MTSPRWNRIAVLGVGLIGGSVGMALLKRRLAAEVVGIGRSSESLAAAQRAGAITQGATDLAQGIAGAELAIVCTPVENIVAQVIEIARQSTGPLLITDAGSTKAEIVHCLADAHGQPGWTPGVRFVGSHPIAGSEKQGAEHGSADLFSGRTVVVTPSPQSVPADVELVEEFWSALDARVVQMSAEAHDEVMAGISHLPHLVASAIAGATPERYVSLSGSGWQDTTRVAAGSPALWRQILLANRAHVLASLSAFDQQIAAYRQALEAADGPALEQLLDEARRIRNLAAG